MLETEELLEKMRDLAPPPIPTAPPVPWIFFALAALALIAIGVLLALRFGGRSWRREARAGFAALAARGGDPEALTEAARLLRRVALKSLGPETAKLTGEDWLKRLDGLFKTDFFTAGAGRVFGAGIYAADPPPGGPILKALADLAGGRRIGA